MRFQATLEDLLHLAVGDSKQEIASSTWAHLMTCWMSQQVAWAVRVALSGGVTRA